LRKNTKRDHNDRLFFLKIFFIILNRSRRDVWGGVDEEDPYQALRGFVDMLWDA